MIIRQYRATERQVLLHRSKSRYVLYGGAMGGGKSWGGIAEGFRLSWKYSGNRGVIIRKNMTTLKRTILKTYFKVVPSELIKEYNKQEMRIKLINGSEILFMEADKSKDPLFDKFKSLEVGWFHIEEASEVDKGAFQILSTRLRWRLPSGGYPEFKGILTSNPEECWLKESFLEGGLRDSEYIQALPRDNLYLPKGYIEGLREVLSYEQQKRYLEGIWEMSDKPDQLILYQWVKDSEIFDLGEVSGEEYYLGCDVARFGDDSSTMALILGNCLIDLEQYRGLRTDKFAAVIASKMEEYKIGSRNTGVDVVGLGAGTVDSLYSKGKRVREIQSGGKAPVYKKYRFNNMRSYMWWQLREDFKNGEILLYYKDKELIQELMSVRYRIRGDLLIEVERKKEIKKRLGRSPDKAEAFVYANSLRHKISEGKGFKYISLLRRKLMRVL